MNENAKQLLARTIREKFDKSTDTEEMESLISIAAESGLTGLAIQMESDMFHEFPKTVGTQRYFPALN
jgi:hypothetical protein